MLSLYLSNALTLSVDRDSFTIVGIVLLPLVLTVAVVAVVLYVCTIIRRAEGEVRIREAEADMREADALLARLRVRAAKYIIRRLESSSCESADALIQELIRQTSPSVADLGRSALIGNVGVTLPKP